MKNFLVLIALAAAFLLIACDDSCNCPKDKVDFTDIDGNVYDTVKICDQIWMAENLNVAHYRNGDTIPEITNANEWKNTKIGAWCHYNNDPANGDIYGKLYNWYAVIDVRGLAPEGWHISTDEEWTTLADCLGGSDVAGGKLKSTGILEEGDGLWLSPNLDATNETGFSALPSGWNVGMIGKFDAINKYSNWWTYTWNSSTSSWSRCMYYNSALLNRMYADNRMGFSVRCIKDK